MSKSREDIPSSSLQQKSALIMISITGKACDKKTRCSTSIAWQNTST